MKNNAPHYFAYGSNLCPRQMEQRCPAARPLGAARLPDHRLTFPRHSHRWQCGVAGLEATAGERVEGVVYQVTHTCLLTLDHLEGVGAGRYRRLQTTVQTRDGGNLPVVTYQAQIETGGPFDPAPNYLRTMIQGARAHGLSPQWIAQLVSMVDRAADRWPATTAQSPPAC